MAARQTPSKCSVDRAPNEAVSGRPDKGYKGTGGSFYLLSDIVGREAIDWVTGDDPAALRGDFGDEARGARGAVGDAASEVP